MDNYVKEERIIDISKAGIQSLLFLIPILLIFGLPFYLLWAEAVSLQAFNKPFGLNMPKFVYPFFAMGIVLLGIVLHELIHGITWSFFTSKGFKSITFGVMKKTLTPYCHCKEPLQVKHYVLGALMPAIIVGILPAIIALFIGSFPLLLFGMFFILAAGGDFLIVNLLKREPSNNYVEDHPTAGGCYVYRKAE